MLPLKPSCVPCTLSPCATRAAINITGGRFPWYCDLWEGVSLATVTQTLLEWRVVENADFLINQTWTPTICSTSSYLQLLVLLLSPVILHHRAALQSAVHSTQLLFQLLAFFECTCFSQKVRNNCGYHVEYKVKQCLAFRAWTLSTHRYFCFVLQESTISIFLCQNVKFNSTCILRFLCN